MVFNFIFRAQMCFHSYEEARTRTNSYLDRLDEDYPNVTRYYLALSAWETFVHQYQNLVRITIRFPKNKKVFEIGDNSPEERVYEVANDIKHAVNSGQRTPIWLTNSGIHSTGGRFVTYKEVAKTLSDLPEDVGICIDAASAKEKLKKRKSAQ